MVLYYTVLYYTVLYCTVMYFTVPVYGELECNLPREEVVVKCSVLYHAVLHCTALYFTVLFCTVPVHGELECDLPWEEVVVLPGRVHLHRLGSAAAAVLHTGDPTHFPGGGRNFSPNNPYFYSDNFSPFTVNLCLTVPTNSQFLF